jgi:NADPH:quinone reductase-like Zn-dependent oxidoreductase
MRVASLRASHKVVFFIAKVNREDLVALGELLEGGKVTPVVERTYELSEFADALAYLGAGHARAKIVLRV